MIGSPIGHYKVEEKLGEVPNFPASVPPRADENLRTPPPPSLTKRGGGCPPRHL